MKPKVWVCNAFSLSMLDRELQAREVTERIPKPATLEEVKELLGGGRREVVSAVGHADTARIFSALLGREVPVNRVSVRLTEPLDVVVVGQYMGPRLPEGATELPEGARIEWWVV